MPASSYVADWALAGLQVHVRFKSLLDDHNNNTEGVWAMAVTICKDCSPDDKQGHEETGGSSYCQGEW